MALEVQNRVNALAIRNEKLIHLMTWEQELPSAGRPQDLINRMVDECDLFVGLLYEQWGTPTGDFSSGFAEEFDRAASRNTKTGAPDIALFFKKPRRRAATSPSPDLGMIESFKAITSQRFLHAEIQTKADWQSALTLKLISLVSFGTDVGAIAANVQPWVGSSALSVDDLKASLIKAVGMLPEREKTVLTLYYYEGLNIQEIADILGVSPSTTGRILTKARREIRSAQKDFTLGE